MSIQRDVGCVEKFTFRFFGNGSGNRLVELFFTTFSGCEKAPVSKHITQLSNAFVSGNIKVELLTNQEAFWKTAPISHQVFAHSPTVDLKGYNTPKTLLVW